MLLRRVSVSRWNHEIVDHNKLLLWSNWTLLSIRIVVLHRDLVLLVVETVRIRLNLLWQRPKESESIWSASNNFLIISWLSVLIDLILALSLRPQTLVSSKQAKRVDSNNLALLKRGR